MPPPSAAASLARLVPRKKINEREPETTVENRNAPRLPASHVPSITGVRVSPNGAEATLVNISASGVLVECSNRLKPGSVVNVVFEGRFSPSSIQSRVARSSVAGIGKNGALRYHVGIAFKNPIALDDAPAPAANQPETAQPRPNPTPVPAVQRNRW